MEDSVGMIANTDAYKSLNYTPSAVMTADVNSDAGQFTSKKMKTDAEEAANEMAHLNSKSSHH